MTEAVQASSLVGSRVTEFDWRGAGDESETDKGVVDGVTSIITEADHFFVKSVQQLF